MVLSWHPYSTFDFRDAEVSAQMREVKWADRSGNLDEVHFGRPRNQNRDVADRLMLPVDPQIGHAGNTVCAMVRSYAQGPENR